MSRQLLRRTALFLADVNRPLQGWKVKTTGALPSIPKATIIQSASKSPSNGQNRPLLQSKYRNFGPATKRGQTNEGRTLSERYLTRKAHTTSAGK